MESEISIPEYAPIVLFCYNRVDHLQQTITALAANELADQCDLIIYSDGFKGEKDYEKVVEVRNYLSTITGFRTVTLHEAHYNQGLANSVINGVSEVMELHGKAIVLEDDIVTAPDFLVFMNQLLEQYQDRMDIFSVTGYAPKINLPSNYLSDVYLAPRASSWGWGTWANRWQAADWTSVAFSKVKENDRLRASLLEGGEDLWPMLVKQQRGVIDSWAIRWTLVHILNNAYGVFPRVTKVINIGTDGSGTNFNFSTTAYDNELSTEVLTIPVSLSVDQGVLHAFQENYRLPWSLKLKNLLKYQIR